MPDRKHEDLEKELRDLGPRIKYPPTPDVARTVRRRLDAQRSRGLRAFVTPGWLAAAAATILLSLVLLSPVIRSTVPGSMSSGGGGHASGGGAGASGAGSAEYAAQPPTHSDGAAASGGTSHEVPEEVSVGASAGTSASPPSSWGSGLGEEIPASEARARMGKLLLPETPELPGEPGMIYARSPSEADGVVVVFGPGPGLPPLSDTDVGLLLVEVPGDIETAYPPIAGASGPPTEEVDVGGRRGYWLPDGRLLRPQPGDRLPGGALLWEREDTALLLRANVTREEAIRIAGTIR